MSSEIQVNDMSPIAKHDDNGASKNDFPNRTKLPVPQPDKSSVNLWSYLKNCIGKELHKITMPVQWNEPISLLQRISEHMTYAHLLNQTSGCQDSVTRMQWVAAFAVSSIASNIGRMNKPFNPLLGETYELQKKDFQIILEQVGHHPPVSAFHAEGLSTKYVYRGSVNPKTKFWGKSVEFTPKGPLHVDLKEWGETYTWSHVTCAVHNLIVGKLWMEHVGSMEITNEKTGHKCHLTFKPGGSRGWLTNSANSSDDLHTVEGFLTDHIGKKVKFLYGKWTEYLCIVDAHILADFLDVNLDQMGPGASNLPKHPPLIMGAVPNSSILWQATPRSVESESYYNFSEFAMGLNQLLPIEQQDKLCRTDCRHRPDIRPLEEGGLEMAAAEKDRLENKQREYRKPFKGKKLESDWWTPRWFIPVKDEFTKEDDWKYVGQYWESKQKGAFENIPDIY